MANCLAMEAPCAVVRVWDEAIEKDERTVPGPTPAMIANVLEAISCVLELQAKRVIFESSSYFEVKLPNWAIIYRRFRATEIARKSQKKAV